jgi:hypothetical protein
VDDIWHVATEKPRVGWGGTGRDGGWPGWPRSLITGNCPVRALEPTLVETNFITDPVRLQPPFEIAVERTSLRRLPCPPPAYDRARAALIYGDVSRVTVRASNTGSAQAWPVGRLDGGAVRHASEADLITLSRYYFRLIRRGFNQSGWLAAAFGPAASGCQSTPSSSPLHPVRATSRPEHPA